MQFASYKFLRSFAIGLFALINLESQAQLTGQLSRYPIESNYVSNRRVEIWKSNSETVIKQVLILHDGQMLFQGDSTWNKQEWGLDECLDSLIQKGMVENTLVVGIWNLYEERHFNYFPQKPFESLREEERRRLLKEARPGSDIPSLRRVPNSDNYLRFIFLELLPKLKRDFALEDSRVNMIGSSMGGLITMYAALEYPEELDGVACLSTHWPGIWRNEENPIPAAFIHYIRTKENEARQTKWYYDRGDATLDSLYAPHQDQVDATYLAWKLDSAYKSVVIPGAEHSEKAWRARLPQILIYLLGND